MPAPSFGLTMLPETFKHAKSGGRSDDISMYTSIGNLTDWVDTQIRWQSERGNLEGEQGAVGVHAKLPPHCLVLTAVVAVLVQSNLQVMHLRRTTIWSTLASSSFYLQCRSCMLVSHHSKLSTLDLQEGAQKVDLNWDCCASTSQGSCVACGEKRMVHQLAAFPLPQDRPVIQLLASWQLLRPLLL